MKALNVGCGPDVRDGWTNVDSRAQAGVIVSDLTVRLTFADDEFDIAVLNHVLQDITWADLVPALTEVRRVLRPGGTIRLLVPDLVGAVTAWAAGITGWFPIADQHEPTIDGKLCMYVTQAGKTRSVFTRGWVRELLIAAGFTDIRPVPFGGTTTNSAMIAELDSRQGESLIFEATA